MSAGCNTDTECSKEGHDVVDPRGVVDLDVGVAGDACGGGVAEGSREGARGCGWLGRAFERRLAEGI